MDKGAGVESFTDPEHTGDHRVSTMTSGINQGLKSDELDIRRDRVPRIPVIPFKTFSPFPTL